MLRTTIVPILAIIMSVLFMLACLGEKKFENKVLYAASSLILMVMLLLSRTV